MKKLILSSLLFASIIGVGAGAYIINGSYSPLNTAINVELGDKFGYEIVLNATSLQESMNNTSNTIRFKPCNDTNFNIETVTTESTTSNSIDFGMAKNFESISGISPNGLEIKSIEFELVDDNLNSINSYVQIDGFIESTVGCFIPNTTATGFSIVPSQTLKVNSIIVTLGI